MLNKFYNDHNLEKFISFDDFSTLEVSSFQRGKKFLLDHMYFLISGSVELFITNEKDDTMKVSNINNRQFIIGILKPLDYQGMSLFYKAAADVHVVSIPNALFDKLESDIEFLKTSRDIVFHHLLDLTQTLFIRNMYSSNDVLRYTLEQNTNENGEFFIDDLKEFLLYNNLSRSIFYNNIKTLEADGDIIRNGSFIKFLNYKFVSK
jgi:hypothetical protein